MITHHSCLRFSASFFFFSSKPGDEDGLKSASKFAERRLRNGGTVGIETGTRGTTVSVGDYAAAKHKATTLSLGRPFQLITGVFRRGKKTTKVDNYDHTAPRYEPLRGEMKKKI